MLSKSSDNVEQPPSLICVFAGHMKTTRNNKCPIRAQRRLRSHAVVSLLYVNMSFCLTVFVSALTVGI